MWKLGHTTLQTLLLLLFQSVLNLLRFINLDQSEDVFIVHHSLDKLSFCNFICKEKINTRNTMFLLLHQGSFTTNFVCLGDQIKLLVCNYRFVNPTSDKLQNHYPTLFFFPKKVPDFFCSLFRCVFIIGEVFLVLFGDHVKYWLKWKKWKLKQKCRIGKLKALNHSIPTALCQHFLHLNIDFASQPK